MTGAYDTWCATVDGRRYTVELHHDDHMGEPWHEHDGHGPVTDWTTRAKAPGEAVLAEDGRYRRYYDFAAATRIALADGWGLSAPDLAKLANRLGRQPTRRQIAREAVLQDFYRLRRWCAGDWHRCGVVVASDCGEYSASLWGIESDCTDYIRDDVVPELVRDIAQQIEATDAAINAALARVAAAAAGVPVPGVSEILNNGV